MITLLTPGVNRLDPKYQRKAVIKYYNDRMEIWTERNGQLQKIDVQDMPEDLIFFEFQIPKELHEWYYPVIEEDYRSKRQ